MRRSITLIPVSNISVFDSSWSNAGAVRWIGQRSLISSDDVGTSRDSPSVLNTWPFVTSPTGTEIGAPLSTTAAPRTMPSVGCMEIARTRLSPMCWATSRVKVRTSPESVTSTRKALKIAGIASDGNSISTTGPITRATRPFLVAVVVVIIRSLR